MAGEPILVVEDNEKDRKLVRDILTFKGYQVIETERSEEGARVHVACDQRFPRAVSAPAAV